MLTPDEKLLLAVITKPNLRLCVDTVYSAVKSLWEPSSPRIVQDFTDHGIAHYERISTYAGNIISSNKDAKVSATEMFLLVGGIYLHDVGMQCDVTTEDGKQIKLLAEELGAKFDVEFTASQANNYSKEEQRAIRKNHHFLSAAWIEYAFKTGKTVLGPGAKSIPFDLVPDLMDICLHHTTLPIGACKPTPDGGGTERKRLIAAILRFADELDIDSTRVDMVSVTSFAVSPENSVHWWLHNLTKVTFYEPNVFKIMVRMCGPDYQTLASSVQSEYLNRFRTKNTETMEVLREYSFPIFLDADGGVIELRTAPELPIEIKNALKPLSSNPIFTQEAEILSTQTNVSHSNDINIQSDDHVKQLFDTSQPNSASQPEPPLLKYRADLLPVIEAWVGRARELHDLSTIQSGVVVVTGIGGQGKSTLVTKFLEEWRIRNPEGMWDWRDCREEGERFHTQIVAVIEHLTYGKVTGDMLTGADTKSVVRYLFKTLDNKPYVLILDNVDHYVNVLNKEFRLGVATLVQEALRVQHNLLIILTCRPRVDYASPRFLEVHLKGLELSEAIELFHLRGITQGDAKILDQIREIWSLTEGHPLWLNLIAVQMSRNTGTAAIVLQELRERHVDDRALSMFRAFWNALNDRQKTILRCMSELSYPESVESIHNIVGSTIASWNQFNRAFNGIRAVSLVVERRSTSQGAMYDLHPLVRSFIRTEFRRREDRLPFIKFILNYFERVLKGGKEPSVDSSLELLERWTNKAELELASNNLVAALLTLSQSSDQLIAKGFHEEFFRVAKQIVDQADWNSTDLQETDAFHSIIQNLIYTLAEHKREEEARLYLDRYRNAVSEGTVEYLRLCGMTCYLEWTVGDLATAIVWGQKAVDFKKDSQIDTNQDYSTDYALVLRDSGRWDEALKIIAPAQSIDEILMNREQASEKDASFYGNVGRCLQFKGSINDALRCYVRSANLLYINTDSISVLNKGFAYQWIGECLEAQNDFNEAFVFYRAAHSVWAKRAPLRVAEPLERMKRLVALIADEFKLLSDAEVELWSKNWIANFRV